jgi:hypothetical protein
MAALAETLISTAKAANIVLTKNDISCARAPKGNAYKCIKHDGKRKRFKDYYEIPEIIIDPETSSG